jgi:hypothetical protein
MKTIEEKAKEYGGSLTITRETQKTVTREDFEQAFLAGAQAVQEWRNVDDELPEPFEEVLVKIGSEIAIAYISDNGEYEWYLQGESALRGYAIEPDFWRPIECK